MLHCGNGKTTCENKLRSYKYTDYTMTKERLFYKEEKKFHFEGCILCICIQVDFEKLRQELFLSQHVVIWTFHIAHV